MHGISIRIYIYTVTYLIMFIRMHVLFYNARLDIEIVSCFMLCNGMGIEIL